MVMEVNGLWTAAKDIGLKSVVDFSPFVVS